METALLLQSPLAVFMVEDVLSEPLLPRHQAGVLDSRFFPTHAAIVKKC